MTAKTISFFFLITLLLCVCGDAQRRGSSAGTTRIDLQSERIGHESSKFLAVVGNWSIVEDNVVLWTCTKGVRKFVKRGSENVPLQKNTWHNLQISVRGTSLQAALDGKHLLDYTLTEAVSGKIGLWSKTDSVIYFNDFTVSR